MSAVADRHILLGVTGGIAAYKAADLVRKLRDAGARVRVAITAGATEFVTPLTFQALSGEPVHLDLLDPAAEAAMGHIELARWADAVLIAPASADFMARLAHGHANDLLSTVCLATEAPLFVAPAMNRLMWANPATQANARLLSERGMHLLGPGAGEQACGEVGAGRMLEPLELVAALGAHWSAEALRGRTVLLTAGPTREPLDPVRYISNRSSGKMGFALAAAAREAGARVLLVAGPCALATPAGVERIDVESAEQMHQAVMARVAEADIFIASAAVSDYRPVEAAARKIKKRSDSLSLELRRNPDILRDVAALPSPPFTVGFAAETHELAHYAEGKRRDKRLDMIAANWVGDGRGFDRDDNALEVFWEGGHRALGRQAKASLARELMSLITEHHEAQH